MASNRPSIISDLSPSRGAQVGIKLLQRWNFKIQVSAVTLCHNNLSLDTVSRHTDTNIFHDLTQSCQKYCSSNFFGHSSETFYWLNKCYGSRCLRNAAEMFKLKQMWVKKVSGIRTRNPFRKVPLLQLSQPLNLSVFQKIILIFLAPCFAHFSLISPKGIFFYLIAMTPINLRFGGSQYFPYPLVPKKKAVRNSWNRTWVFLLRQQLL